ncbi:MAG: hypothetical protein WBF47_02510 [Xanthobacteraceae bacterium]|jgi:hypothetical protein
MKRLVSSKYLSAAFAVTAFATIGSVSAFAQSLSRDGNLMLHYFDASDEPKWGGRAPPAAEQKVVSIPHRNLYLSAGQHPRLYAGQHQRNTRVR